MPFLNIDCFFELGFEVVWEFVEKVDVGEGFEGVDGDGVVEDVVFAFGVGENEGDGFVVGAGDVEQGFVVVVRDGDVVGADGWVLFVLQYGTGDDVQGIGCDGPVAHVGLQAAPDAAIEGRGLRGHVAHEKGFGHGLFGVRHIGGGTEVAAIVAGAFVILELGGTGGDVWIGAEIVCALDAGLGHTPIFGESVVDPFGLFVVLDVGERVVGVLDDFGVGAGGGEGSGKSICCGIWICWGVFGAMEE